MTSASRSHFLASLAILAGCVTDPPPCTTTEPPAPQVATKVHCWRCDRIWTEPELAAHEQHRIEHNLMMSASGCAFCRYHGAYKDIEYPKAPPPTEVGPGPPEDPPGACSVSCSGVLMRSNAMNANVRSTERRPKKPLRSPL